MGRLSLIPKGVVTAMQVALVALVLLAAVPIATGGLDVTGGETNVSYDDSDHTITFEMDMSAGTSLYFEINAAYDVSLRAGNVTVPLYEGERVIPSSGTAVLSGEADMPLVCFIMMMVCAAANGSDVTVIGDLKCSTLGGMLTLSASVVTVIATISNIDLDVDDIEMNISFTVSGDITDSIFGSGISEIVIGDVIISISSSSTGDAYDAVITMDAGGIPLTEALEAAADAAADDVPVTYDGVAYEIGKDDVLFIVHVLERCT
ncbi:MAG: hypothetical protein FWD81_04705 [Methanomassiliicoccaceae archaeon]|nr:hypothetical protein [Methanomassiliicoccaceae archaeon]